MFSNVSRRSLLRGLGVSMSLPWLESLQNSSAYGDVPKLEKPPLRSAFLFFPNGVVPSHWTPKGEGRDWELTPMLKPLAGVKQDVLLLENLWNKQSVGRNGHWPKIPCYLTGGYVVRTAGRDLDCGGISVDQKMSELIGMRTPLPSIQLAVDSAYSGVDNVGGGFARIYGSHISWRNANTPIPNEIVPQLAFDRLFRSASTPPALSGIHADHPAVKKALQRDQTSVLDLVMDDAKSLQRKVGQNDQAKLNEYLESVRSIEKRIEASMQPQARWVNSQQLKMARPEEGRPDDHREHVKLMLDIMVLAFWTDSTRIASFMFGNAQTGRNFGFLDGVKGSYHGLSHHREEKDKRDMYEKIGTWHVEQFAYLVEKMRSLDEGGTSLLDNSQILFGTTLKDGNKHTEKDLPILVAGRAQGKIEPGRRLISAKETPLCNLHLSFLKNAGCQVDYFGDSTGTVEGLAG